MTGAEFSRSFINFFLRCNSRRSLDLWYWGNEIDHRRELFTLCISIGSLMPSNGFIKATGFHGLISSQYCSEQQFIHCWFFNMNDTNDTAEQNPHSGELSLPYAIATGTVLFSILFMTVFGNLLVLLSVAIYKNLRHTTNYFIVNLACADLLLGLSVLPFSAMLDILGYWPFGPTLCIFWTSVDVLWCTGSIITLCVISVDRYIGITRPLQHGIIMSERRACWIISLVWIVSLAISIGPVFGWRHDRKLASAQNCHVNREPAYVLFSVTGSFYIPLFIIVFVYSRIFKTVNEHSKNLQKGETTMSWGKSSTKKVKLRIHTGRSSCNTILNGNSKQNMSERLIKFSRQKKAAKTLGIVVGVFLLCWFPFFLVLPLGKYSFDNDNFFFYCRKK